MVRCPPPYPYPYPYPYPWQVPTLPKDVMRKAFEELGALYLIYWRQDGSVFRVAADYEVPSSINSRLRTPHTGSNP